MDEYRDILEVCRVDNEALANDLRATGWVLLAVAPGQDEDHFPIVHYVLGRPYREENNIRYL